MDGNDRHQVRITARGDTASVQLDGQLVDPRSLGSYTVSHVAGEVAHVVLHVADRGDVHFEVLARVVLGDAPEPGPAAAAFLAAIDPETLERTALARLDLGSGPYSLTQAMLDQLREWARGD